MNVSLSDVFCQSWVFHSSAEPESITLAPRIDHSSVRTKGRRASPWEWDSTEDFHILLLPDPHGSGNRVTPSGSAPMRHLQGVWPFLPQFALISGGLGVHRAPCLSCLPGSSWLSIKGWFRRHCLLEASMTSHHHWQREWGSLLILPQQLLQSSLTALTLMRRIGVIQ